MVGAYGNTWIRTGQLDDLASESFVFDQAFISNPRLAQLYQGYWLGSHAELAQHADSASLPRLLTDAGMQTVLITDEPEVSELAQSAHFVERIFVEPSVAEQPAEDMAETQLARIFGVAIEWLASSPQPFCLWLHARGMGAPWDAPCELREQYADEEDPESPLFVAVPQRQLSEGFDPDELLGITHAYAGQVSALDTCVGALRDELQRSGLAGNTQFTFLSARGFPLGEHLRVGACDDALYNELVQFPWMMRFPDGRGKLARSQALVRPGDLPATLLDWLLMDCNQLGDGNASSLLELIDNRVDSTCDRILITAGQQRAIRTPAWLLRESASGLLELYAKPSDRWEVNEVANLCPHVVSGLQAAMDEMAQSAQGNQLRTLDDILTREFD